MSLPFIAEIRIMAFTFPPKGWALCNGQTLAISQNQALFSVIGTTYGGNGTSTFALPNFEGLVPVHVGPGIPVGATGGEVAHTLTTGEIPQHIHTMMGVPSPAANQRAIAGNMPGNPGFNFYNQTGSPAAFNPAAVGANAGGQPHPNTQPSLVVSFCIALTGIYPSRN